MLPSHVIRRAVRSCQLCDEVITDDDFAADRLDYWGRVGGDSGNGYEVVHTTCMHEYEEGCRLDYERWLEGEPDPEYDIVDPADTRTITEGYVLDTGELVVRTVQSPSKEQS